MRQVIAEAPFRSHNHSGRLVISTVSHGDPKWRMLSPFLLGPCRVNPYGEDSIIKPLMSENMENAWQYSKVYPEHLDEFDEPRLEWMEWAFKGFASKKACRYPMGKGAKPLYSLHDGKKLGYIEARKAIYIPLYKEAVLKTEAWQELVKLYKTSTTPILLLDYDGYDVGNGKYEDALNNPNKIFGHSMVLAMMLEELYGRQDQRT